MRIYNQSPSELVREVITMTGMKSDEIIKAMMQRGYGKEAAQTALNRVLNGMDGVTSIENIRAVMEALGVKSWGVKEDKFYADAGGRVPGSGRKRRTPDRIYNEVLEGYARDLRHGGKLLKRRELAALCGVSLPQFNRWLSGQERFAFKGEKNGTKIWDTAE
ncbi:hypothetical protein [Escherichia coli]|uniref:hypothetical protein n=1 Tax=Escherichia coli TaxID=562 RepID=UPI001ADC85CF|nr:hypothetical protein [Escherichia coli]MBO9236531.1 hypothetical protein [Escherichia coli]